MTSAAEPTGPAVNATPDPADPGHDDLGGRLPLLKPGDLDPVQAQARDGLVATRGADARAAGFTMELPGGELIGPFNAYLHVPAIFQALRDWMAAIQEVGLPGDVQQVAIVTVGAAWRSDYEVYAHTAEARHAGVPDSAIDAILAGAVPVGLSPAADVAYRLALALAVDHAVDDGVYAEAQDVFSTEQLIALVNLIGRYMNTAAILACFRVPAPPADPAT
jgi:4-carboxymuconolactone decarboxylase